MLRPKQQPDLYHLPTPVLALILQHVTQRQLLKQTALVNSQWAAAARMATVVVCAYVAASKLPDLSRGAQWGVCSCPVRSCSSCRA